MKSLKLLLLVYLLLPVTPLKAQDGKELTRLQKCYSIFVNERIESTHPLWIQVSDGTLSGADACMSILDKANLGSQGLIPKDSRGQIDPEGRKVLATFLRFHKSQFEVPDYGATLDFDSKHTLDVVDSNEPAYHFLYSLFAPDEKFSNIVTRNYSIRALRESQKTERTRSISSVYPDAGLAGFWDQFFSSVSNLVETGLLIGLERDSTVNNVSKDLVYYYGVDWLPAPASNNSNEHFGGGVMGTQAYLMGNMGKDLYASGGTQTFRRWGKHVLGDLLCRDLPALRSKDIMREVYPNSTIAFRTGISCMTCHASMDPLAGVIRNNRLAWNTLNGVRDFSNWVRFTIKRAPDREASPHPTLSEDYDYYRRPPQGNLFYRSYDGSLVNQNVEGLEDLGSVLAGTNDLYVCAAKRYYRFLTGIKVSLSDIGDINTPTLSKGEKFQRERVIDLGLKLKNHQSLKQLIKEIISSEAFLYPDRGV